MRRLFVLLTILLSGLFLATPAMAAAPPKLGGGSPLHAGSYHCTAAFAAISSSASGYLITGRGCGTSGTLVYGPGDVLVGSLQANVNGTGLVHVTNASAWTLVGWVGGPGVLTGSAQAPVGASTCLIGIGTGVHCGTIQAKNQTVVFPEGAITGLTRTNVCADPGSAAVTFVSGTQAQGVLIGGSGTCTSGGTTYFVPVTQLLSAYGLSLLTT